MGNLFCPKSSRRTTKAFSVSSVDFPVHQGEVPEETFVLKKLPSFSTEKFSWSKAPPEYLERRFSGEKSGLTSDIIIDSAKILDYLETQLGKICADFHFETTKIHEDLFTKFHDFTNSNNRKFVKERIIDHFVMVFYVIKDTVEYLINGNQAAVVDYLKQIVVSHALFEVTATDFQMIIIYITHYLVRNKIIAEEELSIIIIYMNNILLFIKHFYEKQSVRSQMIKEMTTDQKRDGRKSRARENFRLLKKWKSNVGYLHERAYYVRHMWETSLTDIVSGSENDPSIATEVLQENDCLMRCLMPKNNKNPNSSADASVGYQLGVRRTVESLGEGKGNSPKDTGNK